MAMQKNTPHLGTPAITVNAWLKLRKTGSGTSITGVTQTRPAVDSLEVAVPIELHIAPEVFNPKPVPIAIDGSVSTSPHIVAKQRTQG